MIDIATNRRVLRVLAGAAVTLFVLTGCGRHDDADSRANSGVARLGYVGGPYAAAIYVAEEQAAANPGDPAFAAVPFSSSSDIGYALISGEIEAGLIETTRAAALFQAVDGLHAVGAITFLYGASLVLRKDLDLRLDDLPGRTVAVAGRRCRLLHQFLADAERHDMDHEAIKFVTMPFDQMIPALEARRVDAILTRGGHALLALAQDHGMLYQNWDVTGDDECCPVTLAQVELVLVARGKGVDPRRIGAMVSALEAGAAVPSSVLRAAVAARTSISLAALEPFPVASFTALTDEQQAELGSAGAWEEGDDHDHDHDCGIADCDHPH